MLEVLWRSANAHNDIRYKVLFPITTPLMLQPPYYQDSKDHYQKNVVIFCAERCKPAILFFRYCFRAPAVQCSLGEFPSWCGADQHHFLHWGSHYWGVHRQRFQCAGAHPPQWNQELLPTSALWRWCRPETCMKLWSMWKVTTNQMICNSGLVLFIFCNLQNPELLVTQYFLPLSFGFVIMPERTTFTHPVELTVSLQDVGEIMLSVSAFVLFCSQPDLHVD